jgi:hypothetical protein
MLLGHQNRSQRGFADGGAASPFYGLDFLPARAGDLIDNEGSGSSSRSSSLFTSRES